MKAKLTKSEELIQRLDATIAHDIDALFAQADLHAQAKEEMGPGYLKIWEEATGRSVTKEDAGRLRTLAKITVLRLAGIKEHLPHKLNTLKYLGVMPHDKASEKFLRDAITFKALHTKTTQPEAVELGKMWEALGRYDKLWASDGTKRQKGEEAAHRTTWQTEELSKLDAAFKREVLDAEYVTYVLQRSLPNERSELEEDPFILIKNIEKDLAKRQRAFETIRPQLERMAKTKRRLLTEATDVINKAKTGASVKTQGA